MTRRHVYEAWLTSVPPREVLASSREDARAVAAAAAEFGWRERDVVVRYSHSIRQVRERVELDLDETREVVTR